MIDYCSTRLDRDLRNLSLGFSIWIGDDLSYVVVEGVRLPSGYNKPVTNLLIQLPVNYPVAPPGIGCDRIFVPAYLRRFGHGLVDLHPSRTPAFDTPGFREPWAWFCYENISWCPERDDLISLVETVRADLSRAKLKS